MPRYSSPPIAATSSDSQTPGFHAPLNALKKSRVSPVPLPNTTLFTLCQSAAVAGMIVTTGMQQTTQ